MFVNYIDFKFIQIWHMLNWEKGNWLLTFIIVTNNNFMKEQLISNEDIMDTLKMPFFRTLFVRKFTCKKWI